MSGSEAAVRAAWVELVLGVKLPGAAADSAAGASGGKAAWAQARKQAVATLTALEAAVKTSPHPGRDRAIILVRAIRANLTEMPTTLRQVAELRRYLLTDEIVDAAEAPNVFGTPVALRTPLLTALDALYSELAEGKAI